MSTETGADKSLSSILREAADHGTLLSHHVEDALKKWLSAPLFLDDLGLHFHDGDAKERSDYYLIELLDWANTAGSEFQKTLGRILDPIMQKGDYIVRLDGKSRYSDGKSRYDIAISKRLFEDPDFFDLLEENAGLFSELKKRNQPQPPEIPNP